MSDAESQNFDISEAIVMRGNNLYICEDGAERAFNIQLDYNNKSNTINIYTLPYLTDRYEKAFTNCGLSNISDKSILFNDQKALLYGYVIIEDMDKKLFGMSVYNNGNLTEVITPRYKSIEFVEGINLLYNLMTIIMES